MTATATIERKTPPWLAPSRRISGRAKLSKWGNSVGFRVPKLVLKETPYVVGEEFDVTFKENGDITFSKMDRLVFDDLIDWSIPYDTPTVDWGPDVGSEIISD